MSQCAMEPLTITNNNKKAPKSNKNYSPIPLFNLALLLSFQEVRLTAYISTLLFKIKKKNENNDLKTYMLYDANVTNSDLIKKIIYDQ